jgi:hypothetical protein
LRNWVENRKCKVKTPTENTTHFMEEKLCGSELSNMTSAACHIHLGQVVPLSKTIKDSNNCLHLRSPEGKTSGTGGNRCFWVRKFARAKKEAVALPGGSGVLKNQRSSSRV